MPVTSIPLGSRMQLRLKVGETEEGRTIVRTRSFSNIKPEAQNENIHEVALALSDLQTNELLAVRRVDEHELELTEEQ